MWKSMMRPAAFLIRLLTDSDSPRQIAAGFVLGMLIGLIPKGNLTAVLLSTALFAFNVNLAAGIASAVVFSWVGVWLDPIAHRLGWSLLTRESLHGTWTWLFNLPGMSWTKLNNTVVLGNLLIGLWGAWPVYQIVRRLAERLQPMREQILRRLRFVPIVRLFANALDNAAN
ncbi:hypothetical protein JCM19992_16560 [Thermostilla marina]